MLFRYAAAFGIAWRNRRIPLWPDKLRDKRYDIANFFNLRIPVDKNKTVMKVRTTLATGLRVKVVLIFCTVFYTSTLSLSDDCRVFFRI